MLAAFVTGAQASAHPGHDRPADAAAVATHGSAPERPGAVVERRGVLEVLHGDARRSGREALRLTFLRTSGGRIELRARPGLRLPVSGSPVRVRGRLAGSILTVERVTRLPGRTLQASTGPHTVEVILVNFQDDPSEPWTPAQIEATMFTAASSVSAYFAEQSYGNLTVAGTVHDWVTIPYSRSTCSFVSWLTSAMNAVGAEPLDDATNVMLVFPFTPACNWSGLAALDGDVSWINGAPSLRVMAHELGHNFGVDHARTWTCIQGATRVWLSATCALHDEYGDPFSIMGMASTRHFGGVHKEQLGWIAPANRTVATSGGTFLLTPLGSPAGGVQSLRIPRGGDSIFADVRRTSGLFEVFGAGAPAVGGVTLRLGAAGAPDWSSRLLDTTPTTPTYDDAALLPGQTVVDPVSGISISTLSVDASGATVSVTIPADTSPPSTPALAATVLASGAAQVSWSAATDNVGIAHYVVRRDGVVIATTAALSTVDGAATAGPHGYTVVAVDVSGNQSAPSAPAHIVLPDTRPPTPPGGVRARMDEDGAIVVGWDPGSDDVAIVEYVVTRDGVELGRAAGFELVDDDPGAGVVVYAVRALDAAGNASAPASVAIDLASAELEVGPGDDLVDGVDVKPPSAPRRLRARAIGRRTVGLSWRAASDDGEIASYLVTRNGRVIGRTRLLRYRVTVGRRSGLSLGVLAVDTFGNTGPAATIRLPASRSR